MRSRFSNLRIEKLVTVMVSVPHALSFGHMAATKWEYITLETETGDDINEVLNGYGGQGWDLVTAQRYTGTEFVDPSAPEPEYAPFDYWMLVFKRPIED